MAKDSGSSSRQLDYYELQEHTRRVLEAARDELSRLERERAALIDRIQQMEVMLGIRRFPTERRPARVRSDTLRRDIAEILAAAPERALSATEILDRLVDERAYPRTRSLRTRVYSALSRWSREDDGLERVERGIYRLSDPVTTTANGSPSSRR